MLDTIEFHKGIQFHLCFGPEGGFTDDEYNAIIEIKGVPVSMGHFVLKSETASIVGAGFIRCYYSAPEYQ